MYETEAMDVQVRARVAEGGASIGPGAAESRPSRGRLYVHLNNGEVLELEPITSFMTKREVIVVLNGEDEVATLRRSAVYYACCEDSSTPFLG